LENKPEYSIFWILAFSKTSIEQAHIEIIQKLRIKKDPNEDSKELVCQYLKSEECGP
jgi:hypothetical protein